MSLNQLFEQFVNERRFLKNSSELTIKYYYRCWIRFQRAIPDVDHLDKPILNQFVVRLRESGISTVTCNMTIRGINSFMSWLHENGYVSEHLKIKQLKVEKKVLKTFSDGYEESHLFNLIGASTPWSKATHQMMGNLGTRLLIFEVIPEEVSDNVLLRFIKRGNDPEAHNSCQKAVNGFLIEFFAKYPPESIDSKSIDITNKYAKQLLNWAKLLVTGRREVKREIEEYGKNYVAVAANPAESPFRVLGYLTELAKGHALIHGRDRIDDSDIELISHICISTLPNHLRPIIRELRKAKVIDIKRCEEVCACSDTTAGRLFTEMKVLGIAQGHKDDSTKKAQIELSEEFKWMLN